MKHAATAREKPRPRVVIVGGGFGGLHAAKALRKEPVEVVLIDRHNHHLFQPLLYQLATGGLSSGDIAPPLRWILRRQKNTTVLLAEAIDLDVEGHRVLLIDGELTYDTLILAVGSNQSYFGNDAWKPYAPGLKTVADAAEIRSRVFCAFEAAEKEKDPAERRAWLSFVIVGAGPTGVELAGALAEVARDTLKGDFRNINPGDAAIQLIDGAPRVLPGFPADLSAEAERALIRLGVRPRVGLLVKRITPRGVVVRGEHEEFTIPARTVLWAAGVEASPLARILVSQCGAALDNRGRVIVEPDCSVAGHPEIFVIGDMAAYRGADGEFLPGLAPVAIQQGAYVARLIGRRLRGEAIGPFRYRNKGMLAVIGRHHAVADFGGLRLRGVPAWVVWIFVHLLYLVGFQNRILVAIQWAFHYLTHNRRARLILPLHSRLPTSTAPPARITHAGAAADAEPSSGWCGV